MAKLTKEQLNHIQEYIQSLPESEREPKLKEIMSQAEDQESQCPFCLMSESKISTTKVYEDENFLAVLEINPVNPGHALLFTKRHINKISEFNTVETEVFGKVLKKLGTAISTLGEGINIIDSEGKIAGQRFDHFVVNLIPRIKEDSVKILWQGKQSNENELNKIREKILEAIPVEKPKVKVVSEPLDEDRLRKEIERLKKRHP